MRGLRRVIDHKNVEMACFEARVYPTRELMYRGIRRLNASYGLKIKKDLRGVEAMMVGAPNLVRIKKGGIPQPWGSGFLFFYVGSCTRHIFAHELMHYVHIILRPLVTKMLDCRENSKKGLHLEEEIAYIAGELTKEFWSWYDTKEKKGKVIKMAKGKKKGGKKKC